MNKRMIELAEQADEYAKKYVAECKHYGYQMEWNEYDLQFEEKFAELIVYDFLNELTNDDALGEARIATIKRLAEKWGVAR